MHLSKVLQRLRIIFISLFILFSILIIPTISADNNSESIVDASFDIEFISGTELKILVAMDVKEITVFSSTYDKNGIQTVANNDPETMGAIKLRLRQMVEEQIKGSFNYANITALNNKPTYENILFYDEYNINLTSDFFDLNNTVNAYNFINGVLDMDAVIYYAFNFHAEHGWNNTYTIFLPESMTYRYTTGLVENNKIQWELKNRDGDDPELLAEISIKFTEPSSPRLSNNDIHLEFELDTSNIINIALKTTILVKSMDILDYNILPDFVEELQFVSSDGIRLFIDNDLVSWNDIYLKTINPIEQNVILTIEESSFNQTLEMSFNWNPETTTNCSIDTKYNISNMDNDPPLKAELIDSDVNLIIFDMPARAFFGLVNAGATANISEDDINFGDGLSKIGYSFNILLQLPINISLEGENIYIWNSSSSIAGNFLSDLRPIPKYSSENIDLLFEVEISKMDLDILSFFSGETKLTATSYIKEDNFLYVMNFPNEFIISNKINITFLNSDAFRLCIEEDVFNENDIDTYLTNKKYLFETRLSEVFNNFKITGTVNKDLFYDSLKWDGDISHMDHIIPVVVSTYAYNIYPIAFDLVFWPPQISISNQTFNLLGIENQSVTYRIIFPKGISINAKDNLNKSIIKGLTKDGSEFIELSFDSNEAKLLDVVLTEIDITPVFVLGLFLPCILSFVLVIILIIVVFLIRKKRKGGKTTKEDTESTGYEGQDYYIPPPPSSK